MTKSNAFAGVGTTFNRADTTATSEPSFTKIAEVNSINGPDKSRTTIEVTSLDSDEGYREFIASFRDGGQVSLELNFTPGSYEVINDDFETDSSREYRIILPNTEETQFDFDAYVTDLGMAIPFDDKVTASATFKITGPVRTNS